MTVQVDNAEAYPELLTNFGTVAVDMALPALVGLVHKSPLALRQLIIFGPSLIVPHSRNPRKPVRDPGYPAAGGEEEDRGLPRR